METKQKQETKEQKLARLQKELDDLKQLRPEHCGGTSSNKGYISVHRASADHWIRIEELEEEIAKLKQA